MSGPHSNHTIIETGRHALALLRPKLRALVEGVLNEEWGAMMRDTTGRHDGRSTCRTVSAADTAVKDPPSGALGELTRLFLRLGFTAFGGPAAHIAMMKDEIVTRRQWMTEAQFLDLLGATNVIPGPNSTEMAIHIGLLRGRWVGLLLAGACFILPAVLIVSVFAWVYVRFGSLPEVAAVLYSVKPVIIAVILQAIWGLLKPAVKTRFLAGLGVAALGLALLGIDELLLLFGAGALTGIVRWAVPPPAGESRPSVVSLLVMLLVAAAMVLLPTALTYIGSAASLAEVGSQGPAFGLAPLFLFFLKVGSVLYGSGYVLLAFLRDGLVTQWHWLTEAQLLDATAVGQITPGPVFTTATFIGYLLGGLVGALVATLGIFLPSFVFVALSGPLIPRVRRSVLAGAFLDGVNVSALALMTAVTWQLGQAALMDGVTVGLAVVSAVLLVRYRVNSAWLILGAALLGILLALAGGQV
jgi:chromate transporter